MVFALTCALLAAQPVLPPEGTVDRAPFRLLQESLSLRDVDVSTLPPPAALTLALDPAPHEGSGDGEGHGDHMGAMWVVMGAMMVVMMVGMGVYLMRNEAPVSHFQPASLPSPAQLAVPVTGPRAGGG